MYYTTKIKRCLVASFFLSFIFSLVFCSQRSYLRSEIVPEPSVYLKKGATGVSHSLLCEMSVEHLSSQKLTQLLSESPYNYADSDFDDLLPYHVFLVMVRNSSRQLLKIGKINIKNGEHSYSALSLNDLKREQVLTGISVESDLLVKRRFYGEDKEYLLMDLANDSSIYRFDMILPEDRQLFLVFFHKLPAKTQHFTFGLEIIAEAEKKIVELKMLRRDYRVTEM